MFVPPRGPRVGFGEKYLVCHVRAGEILNDFAPDYPLTPVEFFADLVNETALEPIFMGQTAPNAYTDRLRERFPKATFLPTRDVVTDFETIRQSANVVVGVSTYAWLAAWLSVDAKNIFMAVSGLLNPVQAPAVDLVPFGDERFRFYLFPLNYAANLDRHAEVHRRIAPFWRYVPHAALKELFERAPRFALDRAWYASEYPLAGFEVRGNVPVAVEIGQAGGTGWNSQAATACLSRVVLTSYLA